MARGLVVPPAWSWFVAALGVGFVTLGSSSCIQIGPDASEGGSGQDSGAADQGATVEDQCRRIVAEFCVRAEECYSQNPDYCLDQGVATCCQQACAAKATSSSHAIDTCVSDLKAASCESLSGASLEGALLPRSCVNVVTF